MAPTTSPVSDGTRRLITLAKRTGVPPDSLKRFLEAGYVPQPKQLEFHAACRAADVPSNPSQIGFGGARGGAKTHASFAQVALDDCRRVPGLKALFLRKVQRSASEAVEDLRQKVLFLTPHRYNQQKGSILFPNGSRIILGHFQHEKDIDNYLGLEYDVIVVEEATQLSEAKIEKIATCNRSSKEGFRPRMYFTTNPGGVGHTWFKRKFVTPFREKWTREKFTQEKISHTTFIPSTVYDNKKVNPEYRENLERLTGWLRRAWLHGDFDVFAGQFFEKFRRDLHTAPDAEFFPPEYLAANWENLQPFGAFDYGYRHWAVFYIGYKRDGVLHVLDECAVRLSLVPQIADAIASTCAGWGLEPGRLRAVAAGTDCFEVSSGNGQTGETIADEFAKKGIYLSRANTARTAGASKILALLGDPEQGLAPTVKINQRCRLLIEQLGVLQHDPNKAGDVLKVNADDNGNGGDDAYDAFRYLVMADTESTGLF